MKRFSSRTRSTPLILPGTRATGFAAGQLGPVSTIRFRGVYSAECLVRPVFKYFWDRTMSRGAADAATDERAALPERNLLFDSNVSQRKGFIANRATRSLLFPSVSSFLARNRREKKKKAIRTDEACVRHVCENNGEFPVPSFVCRYAGR